MPGFNLQELSLSPLLVGLKQEELEALLETADVGYYPKGDVIVEEDTPGDTMFMLMDGKVAVEKTSRQGKRVELATLEEQGEFFGEMVFVDVLPRSATVRTHAPSRLLLFHLDDLCQFFEKYREAHLTIVLNIARMLSKRLRGMDEMMTELKGGDAIS